MLSKVSVLNTESQAPIATEQNYRIRSSFFEVIFGDRVCRGQESNGKWGRELFFFLGAREKNRGLRYKQMLTQFGFLHGKA